MNEWDDISFGITVITLRKARIVSKEGWPLYTLPALGIAAVEKHRCRSNAFIHYLRINKDKAVHIKTFSTIHKITEFCHVIMENSQIV